jgi:PIN domain nuclease of toxin-antitoxin system
MKRLLLDTQALLWWLADDPLLGEKTKATIAEKNNDVYVSAATTWEISIKKAIGKLDAPDDMDTIVEEENFLKLPITLFHGQAAGMLPSHHRDPFDKMLIAQAQAEGLTIITSDAIFAKYGVRTIEAQT